MRRTSVKKPVLPRRQTLLNRTVSRMLNGGVMPRSKTVLLVKRKSK